MYFGRYIPRFLRNLQAVFRILKMEAADLSVTFPPIYQIHGVTLQTIVNIKTIYSVSQKSWWGFK
jgi:hypothetical protein